MAERPRRPEWMKVRAPSANSRYFEVKGLMREGGLHTICEEARCPNIGECWGRGTATFQILGDTCTRACRYCYVHSGKPDGPPDPLEPLRLAQAAAQMRLSHVVVTSVDRDDLADRGAGHYAATIRAIKRKLPAAKVEILTPDFLGVEEEALATVLAARPEVFNHNIETVRRLHARMRGAKASYDKALWLLERAKEVADYPVLTKSGIIVGLGETNDEVVDTMRDLRAHGVDVVTIGQYLQPSPKHATIDRWVHPDEFRWFREQGEALGFGSVFSGPARPLVVSRGRAAPRRRNRPRRRRVLTGMRSRAAAIVAAIRPDGERERSSGGETQLRVREYAVPAGTHPHDVAPARDGGVWYTAQHTGQLGWLNPKTGKSRLTRLGTGSAPHGVIVGPDGAPWITDGGLNAIVRVDPRTRKVRRFPLPTQRLREPEHCDLRRARRALVHGAERDLRPSRPEGREGARVPGSAGRRAIRHHDDAVRWRLLRLARRELPRSHRRAHGQERRCFARPQQDRARDARGQTRAGGSGSASGTRERSACTTRERSAGANGVSRDRTR